MEVTHQNIRRLFAATEDDYGFNAADVWTFFHSYAFDFSVWELWGALLYGGRVVVVPYWVSRSPEALHQLLREQRVTVLNQTPSSFYQLDTVDVELGDAAPLSLRLVIFGGEALEPRRMGGWFERHGDTHPRLINMYGITETTVHVTLRSLELEDTEGATGSVIGRPLPDLQVYLLDVQGHPVPIGVPGELYIGGAGLARGYLNRPELTAERFIPNPFSNQSGERLYRTGDLARYRADRNIEYLGRIDHQVKVRGFRIELGEIEARLVEHPQVKEAVVVAREDTRGEKRLVGYVVGHGGEEAVPAMEELRTLLQQTLPEYMVPAAFMYLETLPLTPNGKVDRKGLPAPDIGAQLAQQHVAPRTLTEGTLAHIWAEVLGVERVGIHDNFFALGGHSLLAVTLIERLRRQGLGVDVRALFTAPTVAELAAAVGGERAVDVPPNCIPPQCEAITPEMLPLVALEQVEIDRIVRQVPGGARNVQDIYPLAPLQEGILFHHLMVAEGDVYLLPKLLAFDTRARLERFLGAVQLVINRHDMFRTAVVWEGLPEPVQVVWREAPLVVEEVTLEAEAGDVAEQLRARFDPRHYRLDLFQPPLLRGFITQDITQGRWLLLFLIHHLIEDQLSFPLAENEVQAYLLGRAGQLPAPLPFRNFVAQARLGISREEHEVFFREMLGDVEEPTAPFGLLDVRGDGSGIEEARLDLDSELARRLRARARALGVSAASLCHLAFAQVLTRLSGREDVVFGTVLFGRMQGGAGADRVLGMLLNTLPVRITLGETKVAEAVRGTHALLAELLRHEHASLALAQRCSAVPAPAPLFSALFNYRYSAEDDQAAMTEATQEWEGIKTLPGDESHTNYPVVLAVDDFGEGFRLEAEVQRPIAPERLCAYMQTALVHLVEALEVAPQAAVRTLEVVPAPERYQLLIEWNATETEYPKDKRIHQLFEAQVERSPQATAAVYEDQSLTYAGLNAKANQLAHHLRGLGVGPDTVVGICVERSLEMVVGLLGILKAGGAYLPLDPAYPKERLAYMLGDAKPEVVLTHSSILDALPEYPKLLYLDGDWRSIARRSKKNPRHRTSPLNLAYVIYTSGSTGRPKGVQVTHGSLINFLSDITHRLSLGSDDVLLAVTSLSFDIAGLELFSPKCFYG